jgi:hypothetical protein
MGHLQGVIGTTEARTAMMDMVGTEGTRKTVTRTSTEIPNLMIPGDGGMMEKETSVLLPGETGKPVNVNVNVKETRAIDASDRHGMDLRPRQTDAGRTIVTIEGRDQAAGIGRLVMKSKTVKTARIVSARRSLLGWIPTSRATAVAGLSEVSALAASLMVSKRSERRCGRRINSRHQAMSTLRRSRRPKLLHLHSLQRANWTRFNSSA